MKKEAKREVNEARSRFFDNIYNNLDTHDGQNNIYKLVRMRERKKIYVLDEMYLKWKSKSNNER